MSWLLLLLRPDARTSPLVLVSNGSARRTLPGATRICPVRDAARHAGRRNRPGGFGIAAHHVRQGFGVLGGHVLDLGDVQLKVLDPVVRLILVDMVDILGFREGAAKVKFYYHSMFAHTMVGAYAFREWIVRGNHGHNVPVVGEVAPAFPPRRVGASDSRARSLPHFLRGLDSRRAFTGSNVCTAGTATGLNQALTRANHARSRSLCRFEHRNTANLTRVFMMYAPPSGSNALARVSTELCPVLFGSNQATLLAGIRKRFNHAFSVSPLVTAPK